MPNTKSFSEKLVENEIENHIRHSMASEVSKYETLTRNRTRQKNECDDKRTKLIQTKTKTENDYKNGTAAILKAEQRLKELPSLIQAKQDSIPQLDAELSAMRTQLAPAKHLLNEIDLQIYNLDEPINTSTYEQEMETFQKKCNAFDKEIDDFKRQITELEKQVSNETSHYESSCAELEMFDWEADDLSSDQLRAKFSTLERKVDDSQYNVRRKKRELDELRSALSRTLTDKSRLTEPVNDGMYEKQLEAYTEKLNHLRDERDRAQSSLDTIEEEVINLDQQLTRAHSEIKSLEMEKIDIESSIPKWNKAASLARHFLKHQYPKMIDELNQDCIASEQALDQALLAKRKHEIEIKKKIREAKETFRNSELVQSGYIRALSTLIELNSSWEKRAQETDRLYRAELDEFRNQFDEELKQSNAKLNALRQISADDYRELREGLQEKLKLINRNINTKKVLYNDEYLVHTKYELPYFKAKKIDPNIKPAWSPIATFIGFLIPSSILAIVTAPFIFLAVPQFRDISLPEPIVFLMYAVVAIVYSSLFTLKIVNANVTLYDDVPLEGIELNRAKDLRSDYFRSRKTIKKEIRTESAKNDEIARKVHSRHMLAKKKEAPSVSTMPYRPYKINNVELQAFKNSLVKKFTSDSEQDIAFMSGDTFKFYSPDSTNRGPGNSALKETFNRWHEDHADDVTFVSRFQP